MADWYSSKKAGQVAAFFAKKQGGEINVLKLVKLIYLSERSFMEAYDSLILNDEFVSMDNGPVTSRTLDKINGFSPEDGWGDFVTDRANHLVGVASTDIDTEKLDQLSRAELKTLSAVWDKFGHMSQWDLVKYTHDNCPEWENPRGSSAPIPYERVFKALGKANAEALEAKIYRDKKMARALRD